MNTNKDFKQHHRNARIIFWVGQVIGTATILALLIFIIGTLISEILDPAIEVNLKEGYGIYLFGLCEVFIAVSFIISWKKSRIGAFLVIAFVILANILFWDKNVRLLHIPLLLSGLLILFYSYYREWILKKENLQP